MQGLDNVKNKKTNDAVYKFKRYEDASLVYVGVNKREDEDIGLFDTVLSKTDYHATFENVAEPESVSF